MKIGEAAEMYLETILVLIKKKGQVRSIDIVNEMNYSKPTVSVVMKDFRGEGLINMDDDGYITLTESGLAIAERIYERHQVLSEILMSLGVDEQTASADACKIEHDLSDRSFNCLKEHFRNNLKK